MKLKRMMSGLLSLVLTAGMIPGTIAFAADNEFTNAWGDVIRKDDCIYYEDFENYTNGTFDLSETVKNRGFWCNEIAGNGKGGKYMKYYADLNAQLPDGTTGYN